MTRLFPHHGPNDSISWAKSKYGIFECEMLGLSKSPKDAETVFSLYPPPEKGSVRGSFFGGRPERKRKTSNPRTVSGYIIWGPFGGLGVRGSGSPAA